MEQARFPVLYRHMWLGAPLVACTGGEHFRPCRKYHWACNTLWNLASVCFSSLLFSRSCFQSLCSIPSAHHVVFPYSRPSPIFPLLPLSGMLSPCHGYLDHSLTSCNSFLICHLLSYALVAALVNIAMPTSNLTLPCAPPSFPLSV